MRLLHINSAPKWNGEAAHSVDLARGMMDRGHEVMWVGSRESVALERAREAGLETKGLRLKSRFSLLGEPTDIWAIRQLINEHRPQIVHCHRGKDHLLTILAMRWLFPQLPPVLMRTRHVVMPIKQHRGNDYIYNRVTDYLVAVSKATACSLGRFWPGGESGIDDSWQEFLDQLNQIDKNPSRAYSEEHPRHGTIILSAANREKFHPGNRDLEWREKEWNIPQQAKLVGLVGRIQRIKGQKIFLEAAKLLADELPDVHFACIGHGSPKRLSSLQTSGEESPLAERWHVIGEVDQIEKAIAALDLGVVASRGSEGSSRIMYEYLATGLRTVATRVGGIPEMTEAYPEASIELVDTDNPEALAQAIKEQVARPRIDTASDSAWKQLMEKIETTRWLNNFESLYESILKKEADRLTDW
jgi:glycosyltransferase involved in cell wall biosynthesis